MRTRTSVRSAPTIIGGENESASLRAGPEIIGSPDRFALRIVAHDEMIAHSTAAATQRTTHNASLPARRAAALAASATTPVATIPHPEMAVNEPARSMVS